MTTRQEFSVYEIFALLLILFFAAMLRLPTLFEPWGGDQGVYGYIADGILNGKVPYRDMYTNTGYGLYFAYALFFKLFGNNMAALHIGDLVASLLTVILVYYLTRLLYGRECAVIAALAAALFGSGSAFSYLYEMKGAWGTYWQLAQRETFMAPLITAAILITVIADRRKRWLPYFWTGVLVGLAAIFKVTAIVIFGILILYLGFTELWGSEAGGLKLCMLKITSLSIGAVLIQLPFLYYFWLHDALQTMYKAVFVHTAIYAKLSRGLMLVNAFEGNTYILMENLALWMFALIAMIYLVICERKRETYLVVAWTIGTLLMIWGQGKFFGYHYILIIPPFSLLTGFGIKQFLKPSSSWKDSLLLARNNIILLFLWVLIFANLAAFAMNNYQDYRWHSLYLTGKISKDQYYEVFNEYPLHLYSFRADYEVANYLKTHAKPGASLRTINGGGDTIIHYLSGLKSPTRFTSTWYLFNPDLYDNPLTIQLRNEFCAGIKKEKPDFILLIYYSIEEFKKAYNNKKHNDVYELLTYLDEHYVLDKSFRDRRILYKRI